VPRRFGASWTNHLDLSISPSYEDQFYETCCPLCDFDMFIDLIANNLTESKRPDQPAYYLYAALRYIKKQTKKYDKR
jgi:hypothetical protein